jgi:chemotaxis protein CheX
MPLIDVAYINPFIAATRHLFTTMVKVPLIMGKPSLGRGEPMDRTYQISAVIAMDGSVTGAVVLSLSEAVALTVASAFAQTTMETVNADCRDALGEMTNMIAGQAKKSLPGGAVRLSIPQIVPTAQVIYPPAVPVILIPFDTPQGRFVIQVAYRAMDDHCSAAAA